MVKLKNNKGEYVTEYWYNRGQFAGYDFKFGKSSDAILFEEYKAKSLIKGMSKGCFSNLTYA